MGRDLPLETGYDVTGCARGWQGRFRPRNDRQYNDLIDEVMFIKV